MGGGVTGFLAGGVTGFLAGGVTGGFLAGAGGVTGGFLAGAGGAGLFPKALKTFNSSGVNP